MSLIKLDYDKNYPQKRIGVERIGWISRFLRLTIDDVKAWKTKNGIHVKIWVKERLSPLMIVMIQSLMGSDYARESYNLVRVMNLLDKRKKYSRVAKEHFNVLFYKKKVKGKVASKEVFSKRLTKKLRGELCGKR